MPKRLFTILRDFTEYLRQFKILFRSGYIRVIRWWALILTVTVVLLFVTAVFYYLFY